jgi:hypothetical protein
MIKTMRRAGTLFLVLLLLSLTTPLSAQMRHYEIGKKEMPAALQKESVPPKKETTENGKEDPVKSEEEASAAAPVYHKIIVTRVQECFDKLGAVESAALRRDFDNPWSECQRRLKEREAKAKLEKAGTEKAEKGKEVKGKEATEGEKKQTPAVPPPRSTPAEK